MLQKWTNEQKDRKKGYHQSKHSNVNKITRVNALCFHLKTFNKNKSNNNGLIKEYRNANGTQKLNPAMGCLQVTCNPSETHVCMLTWRLNVKT